MPSEFFLVTTGHKAERHSERFISRMCFPNCEGERLSPKLTDTSAGKIAAPQPASPNVFPDRSVGPEANDLWFSDC